jgi:hypothetical protein
MNKTCPRCGRELIPASARWDGEDTTVGFRLCDCSHDAYLDSDERWNGGMNYEEYLEFRGIQLLLSPRK